MKDDEKAFFKTCLKYCPILEIRKIDKSVSPRNIINTLSEFINYKRCWYLLEKWSNKGFYNYGVTMDLGWFEVEQFTGEYQDIYREMLKKEGINI